MFAGEDPPRDEGIERIDVECDDETGSQSPREVVNQPAATGTQHEDPARRMTRQDVEDRGDRCFVFRVAPCPVAMQVDVVRGEALRTGDARAECAMQLGRGRACGAEWREEGRQPACVVLERSGLQLQAIARADVETRALECGAQPVRLASEIRKQRLQALAPFGQRFSGRGEEPGNAVELRVSRGAAPALPVDIVADECARRAGRAAQQVAQDGWVVHVTASAAHVSTRRRRPGCGCRRSLERPQLRRGRQVIVPLTIWLNAIRLSCSAAEPRP